MFQFVRSGLIFYILQVCLTSAADHWTYDNIDSWPGYCNGGKKQSPIDLQEHIAVEKPFNPFQFKNYDKDFSATVKNNKHSVELRLQESDPRPSIIGADLPSEYILDHLHFHWESEHTLNGKRYPLELHLVHFDSRLGNITTAANTKEGIAVLGVLYNISPDDDEDLASLINLIDSISKHPDEKIPVKEKIRPKDFLPCDIAGFFRYHGSLTTPNCNEVVIWTVFTSKPTLSRKQAKTFETLRSYEGPLTKNYRPIQDLNGRKLLIKISPINAASKSIKLYVSLILVSFFVTKGV